MIWVSNHELHADRARPTADSDVLVVCPGSNGYGGPARGQARELCHGLGPESHRESFKPLRSRGADESGNAVLIVRLPSPSMV